MIRAFLFERFLHPWTLGLLLPLIVAVFLLEAYRRTSSVFVISTGDILAQLAAAKNATFRLIPATLRAFGLLLIAVALAQPVRDIRPQYSNDKIIDIMLCVDVSWSMLAQDFEQEGKPRDRLSVTRDAVLRFIDNRKTRASDRFGHDRIGLILYGSYAWTRCPLTTDYGVLARTVRGIKIDRKNRARYGSTAIGSAIGLAVARLRKTPAKSKVLILLTDGRNNVHEIEPVTAAAIAHRFGIRIYTIGVGSKNTVLLPDVTSWHTRFVERAIPLDEELLKHIASTSGGRYFRVTDTRALHQAYQEINALERTKAALPAYYDYENVFMPWLCLGSALLYAALWSRRRWFEPIP